MTTRESNRCCSTVSSPTNGALRPDLSRPGTRLRFKWKDAEQYRVYGGVDAKPAQAVRG